MQQVGYAPLGDACRVFDGKAFLVRADIKTLGLALIGFLVGDLCGSVANAGNVVCALVALQARGQLAVGLVLQGLGWGALG